MPMHDWTRVEANFYHHFHGRWVFAVSDAMNGGLLPTGFYPLVDQSVQPIIPDVLTLTLTAGGQGRRSPVRPAPSAGGPGVATLPDAPPRVRFTAREKARTRPRPRHRRIEVRHNSRHELVAVIELVSPGNKGSRRDFNDFLDKAVLPLERGVHLLVVDPFPPTRRDPHGIHAAVWRALVGKRFVPPPDKPLTLASYAADEEYTAHVEPIAVGDVLPDMPLFLTPEGYVNVPLEPTYQAAWAGFPSPWREMAAGAAPA